MVRRTIDKLLDWLCSRLGVCIRLDGNLMDAEDW
jgi:hypothetical protein